MFNLFIHITEIPRISTLSSILIIFEIDADITESASDKQHAS